MNREDALVRVKELRELLIKANKHYYDFANPIMGDREYDRLYLELANLEKEWNLISSDSPTQQIGENTEVALQDSLKNGVKTDDDSNEKSIHVKTVSHPTPMLSLANTYNEQELLDFDRRVSGILGNAPYSYFVELKFDGMALRLRYEKGELVLAATRGDGKKGDVITENAMTIADVPKKLKGDFPEVIEVRGEAYMEHVAFANFNENREKEGLQPFANPRNATAGSLKMLDSGEVAKRPIRFFAYDLLLNDQSQQNTHQMRMLYLEEMGHRVCDLRWHCKSIQEVLSIIEKLDSERKSWDFETDGVVIKINEDRYREELGTTAKAPRWAIAYKFESEQATTRLNSITLQVGRLGAITPVAELEPVLLAGTTVKRASLHNEEEIHRKDIREGDLVIIEKAGEIIPQVIEVVDRDNPNRANTFEMPEGCPACGSKLIKFPDEVAWRCVNPVCPPQIRIRIEHFASRDALDIDGLGTSIVDQLVSEGLISTYAHLYDLTLDRILPLERMAEKSAKNLINAIKSSISKPFDRVLYALGIRFVGTTVARDLADAFGSLEQLRNASEEEIANVHGIGIKIAQSVRQFFGTPEFAHIVDALISHGLQTEQEAKETDSNLFSGQTFVLTGTLPTLSRNEAAEIIDKNGGKVSSSVSKNTSYVLAGEAAGSKLEKAQKLGINVISEADFFQILKANQ